MSNKLKLVGLLSAVLLASSSQASNVEANAEFMKGIELFEKEEYSEAVEHFEAAEIQAEDALLKANSIKAARKCYKLSNQLYKEFKKIEDLIGGFPTHIEFDKHVNREFEIANSYFDGYREASGPFGWMKGGDRTIELYEKALKHGPFSVQAPNAKLRLSRLYIENTNIKKAIELLESLISDHPGTESEKYGLLELGNALLQLSRKGDGDGSYGKRAVEVFDKILEKYSDSEQIEWVIAAKKEVQENSARRIKGLADYYSRVERPMASEMYMKQVVTEYPTTEVAAQCEEELSLPSDDEKEVKTAHETLKELDKELSSLVKIDRIANDPLVVEVAPENSDGKWLLPVMQVDPEAKPFLSEEEIARERKIQAAIKEAKRKEEEKRLLRELVAKISKKQRELSELGLSSNELDTEITALEKLIVAQVSNRRVLQKKANKEKAPLNALNDKIALLSKELNALTGSDKKQSAASDELNSSMVNVRKTYKSIQKLKKSVKKLLEDQKNLKSTIVGISTKEFVIGPSGPVSTLIEAEKLFAEMNDSESRLNNILELQNKLADVSKSILANEKDLAVLFDDMYKYRKVAEDAAEASLKAGTDKVAMLKQKAKEKAERIAREQAEAEKKAAREAEEKRLAELELEKAKADAKAELDGLEKKAEESTDVETSQAPKVEVTAPADLADDKTAVSEDESKSSKSWLLYVIIAAAAIAGALFIKSKKNK